jgi:hypothetical protein
MNRLLLISILFLGWLNNSKGQCDNKLDSSGRKQGYWCEYRKERRFNLDSVNILAAEGNYINGKKQGEWKYYPVFKNSDIAGSIHKVIYYPDSGQTIKRGPLVDFMSEDSSYLFGFRRDTILYTYCHRVDSACYLCIRRFPDARFYYKKRFKDFESSCYGLHSDWFGYKIVKLKKKENPPDFIRFK